MSTIDELRDQARRHEQKEEWKQALDIYTKILATLEKQDRPDIALYNRAGDLCVRGRDLDNAVTHYEKAVRLYVEAELPNNAIAVCKKIIRNMPTRAPVYLEMGRIRANQGFVTDARDSFLKYAERMEALGNLDEALRALEELADLLPNETEIRLSLAQQLQRYDRADEAIGQLRAAYATLSRTGDTEKAASVQQMALDIDASADFSSDDVSAGGYGDPGALPLLEEAPSSEPQTRTADVGAELGDIEFTAQEGAGVSGASATPGRSVGQPTEVGAPVFDFGAGAETDEVPPLPMLGDDDEDEAAPLPMLGGDEDDAPPLPLLGTDDPYAQFAVEEEEEEGAPLPLIAFDTASDSEDLTAEAFGETDRDEHLARDLSHGDEVTEVEVSLGELELPGQSNEGFEGAFEEAAHDARATTPEALIAAGDLDGAERMLRELMEREPQELDHRQRLVEVAYRRGDRQAQADAYVELAQCLERRGGADQAQGVYRQVLQIDPENVVAKQALAVEDAPAEAAAGVASSEDYVDLGSLIFGDEEEEEKTTRFKVAYDDPTGDEQADFHKMLSQFKAKVAENLGADDVRAHHDLGTAYKEMGLVDEAIEEFQAALRAKREHLPSYELLGQCFLQKDQPDAAVKTLTRALSLPFEVEDDLIGIYYYIGRAFEQTGDKPSAVEYYDRVFSLDINFMDVTERLRSLR
jgi:tetratricopeptide (TPR) repeat protein